MIITKDQIEAVLRYRFNELPVTSLYLDVDPARNPKEEYLINVKSLIREGRDKLEEDRLSREGYQSVLEDFEKISAYVSSIKGHDFKGLALFSSSKNGFFQVYQLDEPVRDRIIVDHVPYTKPLLAQLQKKKRYIALLLKKDKLRAFEVYGNRIKEELDLFTGSNYSSRSNAYIFINEKKIQNRKETELNKFLREASDEVLHLLMRSEADYIVLGGDEKVRQFFHTNMHPYLKERFAGFINVPFDAKERDVLEAVKAVSAERLRKLDRELVARIHEELSRNGFACKGLKRVLEALSMAAVSVLVVEEGYSCPGYIDRANGLLYTDEDKPASGADNMLPLSDVVNEAVDEAIHQGADVRIIRDASLMEGLDHIAALLRFRCSE